MNCYHCGKPIGQDQSPDVPYPAHTGCVIDVAYEAARDQDQETR